jgi:hypothetical protein
VALGGDVAPSLFPPGSFALPRSTLVVLPARCRIDMRIAGNLTWGSSTFGSRVLEQHPPFHLDKLSRMQRMSPMP